MYLGRQYPNWTQKRQSHTQTEISTRNSLTFLVTLVSLVLFSVTLNAKKPEMLHLRTKTDTFMSQTFLVHARSSSIGI